MSVASHAEVCISGLVDRYFIVTSILNTNVLRDFIDFQYHMLFTQRTRDLARVGFVI